MTNGGPGNTTEMLSTFSYKLSFQLNRYDDSAVVSNVLFVILMFVGLFYIKTIQYEGEA
jgi:multiple sugar transport system permease protein